MPKRQRKTTKKETWNSTHAFLAAVESISIHGPFTVVPFLTNHCLVAQITINRIDPSRKLVFELADLIETCARWGADHKPTTIWLDVKHLELLSFVEKTVAYLIGSGVGLYVTCDGMSSHKPGSLLPRRLCQIVSMTAYEGVIWNALAKQHVPANQTCPVNSADSL